MKLNMQFNRRARIEMLPLIDIVFLLLVFFIYGMLSMAVHRGLPVSLPNSTSADIDKKLIVSLTVKADGSIYLDKEQVEIADLRTRLQKRLTSGHEPGVLLFADHKLSYQKLFNVLDQVKLAGISRISLQAEVE